MVSLQARPARPHRLYPIGEHHDDGFAVLLENLRAQVHACLSDGPIHWYRLIASPEGLLA